MKFIITAGGTGGHIYPALSVLEEIKKDKKNQYLYIGTKNRMENDLIPSMGIPYEGIEIYVEAKGFANDTFPIKKKMFRKYLEGKNAMYFEVYSKKQVLQMINIIKSYDVAKCNK
jgi:UDP-N-acetylglucosamine:LPS N-acetylglucosamine transferase